MKEQSSYFLFIEPVRHRISRQILIFHTRCLNTRAARSPVAVASQATQVDKTALIVGTSGRILDLLSETYIYSLTITNSHTMEF